MVLPGNHDVSRDLEKVSAFDLFKDIVAGRLDNLRAVTEVTRIGENLVSFPWSPVISAEEMVSAPPYCIPDGVAFGHWDVDLRSDPFNLIPTRALSLPEAREMDPEELRDKCVRIRLQREEVFDL